MGASGGRGDGAKIAPLHRLRNPMRMLLMPRGGIINRVGGVKMVAEGEAGRATETIGVTLTQKNGCY
jgi:hypothetical protein